ncbi:hypothetical protein C8Q74DRAFT_1285003 [Fomes fomentarius]|nr:hypothetical protein C8Q74DRAFT_1285003 [Fomes fomentarius]
MAMSWRYPPTTLPSTVALSTVLVCCPSNILCYLFWLHTQRNERQPCLEGCTTSTSSQASQGFTHGAVTGSATDLCCMIMVWKQYPIEEDVAYYTDFTFISQTRSECILIHVSKTVCGGAFTSAP